MIQSTAELATFVGRFHPLLVHLPIGMLILLAALEVAAMLPWWPEAARSRNFVLALALPATLCSAATGWLLAGSGGYDPDLLQWHRWGGVGVAGALALATLLNFRTAKGAYRIALFATCAGLGVTSHFGGSLTHGHDYLTRYAPAPLRKLLGAPPSPSGTGQNPSTDWTRQVVYRDVVQPILDQYCVGCHGPEKSKAKLRLDTHDGLKQGTKDGPVIVAGDVARSALTRVLALPPSDDLHMPPSGKPQPTADDLALIRWWVASGASATRTVADSAPSAELRAVLESRWKSGQRPALRAR
jgi:uncharacterized membrane protein/mono/diheme cytochrome c family protein